ncbi:hypothetical protein ABN028_20610 [Actinopolymorpha sp. B17G11]|uniref:hypothetical protein n=1 Tax=Actinopolymorpha sp. B17G11 TaxID=3160861 RepID=UPI0032E47DCC
MAVGEGKFALYSRIEPPLQAGDYRFTTSQVMSATGHDPGQLPVAELPTHVTVRAPRYTLPPDQVLSTFPPAGSEGAYGTRLPQIVIRRRTLPWERLVQNGVPPSTPWLALVLVAEGEAELQLNQPVAECVTPGRTLPGKADVELGNYLQIRKSMVDRIFPTQLDVPLLAHAREVDIHDTELMMGDDDGFLAVVISNRLPLQGHDADGTEVPVKYLACLVNLEGQFTSLLPSAPQPAPFTPLPVKVATTYANQAQWDHTTMGRQPYDVNIGPAAGSVGTVGTVTAVPNPGTSAVRSTQQASWSTQPTVREHADVYAEMARDFREAVISGYVAGEFVAVDPTLRFPVLLHWSFTSFGTMTFRSLVEGLDSGLLGTVGDAEAPEGTGAPDVTGRPPIEVVETGHTGLAHRTRRGDPVRSWYRGPFVAHPTTDSPADRLPLAHAADQLRIVVPDGREDISLAAAFEIGRLLALARPSMIAALMRWRQNGYQTARRKAVWRDHVRFLDEVLGGDPVLAGEMVLDGHLGVRLGRSLGNAVALKPGDFFGDPAPLVSPGRPLPVDEGPERLLAKGFGLPADLFDGDAVTVLDRLRDTPVLQPDGPRDAMTSQVRDALARTLHREVDRLVADTLAGDARRPDALERLLAGLEAGAAEAAETSVTPRSGREEGDTGEG